MKPPTTYTAHQVTEDLAMLVHRGSFLDESVQESVHAARPEYSNLHGGELLAVLMARIAHDAPQTIPAKPTLFGPASSGFIKDAESVRAQRFLLAALERSSCR